MFCTCKPEDAIQIVGLCNGSNIVLEAWTEISIPEILKIPHQKPDIETIDKIFENIKIISKRIVNTPNSGAQTNWEHTKLTGKKLIIEGLLEQKIVYTAAESTQAVHSAHFCIPFSTFIVVTNDSNDPNEFCIDVCVEDVFAKTINPRKLFKNVTILLNARRVTAC